MIQDTRTHTIVAPVETRTFAADCPESTEKRKQDVSEKLNVIQDERLNDVVAEYNACLLLLRLLLLLTSIVFSDNVILYILEFLESLLLALFCYLWAISRNISWFSAGVAIAHVCVCV